ncbi:hypothetical protein J4419_05565 [Candidatus Woesearchaeota archaeon]|nr:hypothetical protein [Candidatus Woesearchaeota archaeon]
MATKKKKKAKKHAPKAAKAEPESVAIKGVPKEQVRETILTVAGEHGLEILRYLGDKKNISEFVIAEKLKLDMQTVRNTLYKLHTHHLVMYIRKKDRQKGWYISYWTFNKERVSELIESFRKQNLEKLRERLDKEEQNKGLFFICSKACARLDFDQATDFEFKCPECGTLLQQQENVRTIENLKARIREIEVDMDV